jgi:tetratricopeptide (TPR) repeat protein
MAVGRELASQNRWELAVEAFQKVTERQPGYVEGWSFLGEALQHLDGGSDSDALVALETAMFLNPDSLSANILMAMYWKRNGNPEKHYEYMKKAAQINPENPAVMVDLGVAAAILGDLENGYKYHQAAIRSTYNDPIYLRALVEFCLRFNYKIREIALPAARQAVMEDRDNPASLDTMGQLLFRFGDLHNARRFYLRALTEDPGFGPAYLHLGHIYNLMGYPKQAANAYKTAIALAPGTETGIPAEYFLYHSKSP